MNSSDIQKSSQKSTQRKTQKKSKKTTQKKLKSSLRPAQDWIEMFPYGVVLGVDNAKPVLIFKDKTERYVLPVWLNPIEAFIATSVHRDSHSPHQLTFELLKKLDAKIDKVLFSEVSGPSQKIEVFYNVKGSSEPQSMTANAEDVISFCLHSKSKFYTSKDYINHSRDREWEVNAPRRPTDLLLMGNVVTHRKGYLN
ncbi:MAG: bifunctional nuclease family protein [Bdellovibrionales bacterium]|nr:bifunctional nuclease family protein [Bdellovibrionales bacterium]